MSVPVRSAIARASMNWLKTFLSDYGAVIAALSALGLSVFNVISRWMDNKQKASLEITAKRAVNEIEMAGAAADILVRQQRGKQRRLVVK